MSQWAVDAIYIIAALAMSPVVLLAGLLVLAGMGYIILLGGVWLLSKMDKL